MIEEHIDPRIVVEAVRELAPDGGRVAFILSTRGVTRLSPREIEVAALIIEGLRSAEIAERLCISVKTVEAHKGHLARKCGLEGDGRRLLAVLCRAYYTRVGYERAIAEGHRPLGRLPFPGTALDRMLNEPDRDPAEASA